MTSSFDFLKNIDNKLFSIVDNAEKLFKDGYFEQTIIRTRKFGEIVSKNILGVRRTTEETFDDYLATLSDILGKNPVDKEFIDDLYFIKKEGNLAAHSTATEQGSEIALECLKRAYEISINYALKIGRANKKILNSNYDINLKEPAKLESAPKKQKTPPKKRVLPPKKPRNQKRNEEDISTFDTKYYVIVGGILIVFLIGIILFILPF